MVYYADIDNIARVNMESGNVYLNKNIFPYLPLNYQKFIVEHELGHFVLQTDSELEADEYAFNKIAGKTRFSLIDSIELLAEILPFTNKEHNTRFLHAIRRAAVYDLENNSNLNAQYLINKIDMYLIKDDINITEKTNEFVFPAIVEEEKQVFDFPSVEPIPIPKPKITKPASPIELDGKLLEEKELIFSDDIKRDFARPIDLIKPHEEIIYKLPNPDLMENEDLTDLFADDTDEDSFFSEDTIQSDDITDLFTNDTDNDDMFANDTIQNPVSTDNPSIQLPEKEKIKELYNKALEYYNKSSDTTKVIALVFVVIVAYKILK